MDRPVACFITIVVLSTLNIWVMVWGVNQVKESHDRLDKIEASRFTDKDGKEVREMIELNRQETLKNRAEVVKLRDELLVNRKIGQEIIDSLKSKGGSK